MKSPSKILKSRRYSSIPYKVESHINNLKEQSIVFPKRKSMSGENQILKLAVDDSPKFKTIDISTIKNINQENNQLNKFIKILNKPLKEREKCDEDFVKKFLVDNKIESIISEELKYFNLEIDDFFNYIFHYFGLKKYKYLDIIYYDNEKPDSFYYILNEGKVGLYKKETTEEILSYEDYLFYLNEQLNLCEKNKNHNYQKENIESYIDNALLNEIINENSKIYPLFSFDDIKDIKEIFFKIKLYKLLSDKDEEIDYLNYRILENPNLKNEKKIIKIYKDNKMDFSCFNYDKVISEELSYERYENFILENLTQRDNFYIQYLDKDIKFSVKKMKYLKISNITCNNYFGNFPLNINDNNQINKNTILQREVIARCESENLLVVQFLKNNYIENISNSLKEATEKISSYFHERYVFKDINLDFFQKKIYNNFTKETHFKDDIICYQNQEMNNFIMIKEGVSQLIMYNISLFELKNKIFSIKNLLLENAKYYRTVNNKILKDIHDLEIDMDTNLQMKVVKEIIHKKRNFVFSQCNEGLFGEYEYFFNIPCLLTMKLTSEKADFYYYPYEKYKELNVNSTTLNEKLKECAFNKLLNILERMVYVYNSYWRILNEQNSHTENEFNETELKKSCTIVNQIKCYLESSNNVEKKSSRTLLNDGIKKSNSNNCMLTELNYNNDNNISGDNQSEKKEEFICCNTMSKGSKDNSIVNANTYKNKRLINLYSSRNKKMNEDFEVEKINKLLCTKNKTSSKLHKTLFNVNNDNNIKTQFKYNFLKKQFNFQSSSMTERKKKFINKNITIMNPNTSNYKNIFVKEQNIHLKKNSTEKLNESRIFDKFILPPIKMRYNNYENKFQENNIIGEYKNNKFNGKSIDSTKKYSITNDSFPMKNTSYISDVCRKIMDMRHINNNFDIKKARINLLKYRKHKIQNSWDRNNIDVSWGELCYMENNN